MSKNGYRLFKNYDPYITSNFGYRIHPITKVKTLHSGVDYGTNNKKLPTYALEDGKVLATGFAKANGNYVYVNFPRLKKTVIYQHLDKISVKRGDKVTNSTIIGYVGATGEVTGIHLHFGMFPENDFNKSWNVRNWEDFEKYDYPELVKYVGSPVNRDKNLDQIEVTIKNLRTRTSPNGTILGYINSGIYNILNSKITADYTWYMIEKDKWIAYKKEYAKLYLKEEKVEEKDDDIIDQDSNSKEPKEETSNQVEEIPEDNLEEESKTSNFLKNFFRKIIEFIQKILKKLGIL